MNKDTRNKFTKAWDSTWFDDEEFQDFLSNIESEEDNKKLQQELIRKMKEKGFIFIGLLKDVIDDLQSDDAITPSESEDFYSFVEDDGKVEKPGGKESRGLTTRDKLDPDSQVWRYNKSSLVEISKEIKE